MSELTDQYFRDLTPKMHRYDTPLGSGLVFTVFPNGTRCWVLLYTAGGFSRQRILGVFPEMGVEKARQTAGDAIRILAVENELLRSGEPGVALHRRSLLVRMIEDRPYLAVALGFGFAALLGLTVVWLLG